MTQKLVSKLILALFFSTLCACNVQPAPISKALSGSLQPSALELTLKVGTTDFTTSNQNNSSNRIQLVAGHLPINVFANQKQDIIQTVNTWQITAAKKTELVNGATEALDKLELDINHSLDALPNRIEIAAVPPIGGHFKFTNQQAQVVNVDGLYDSSSSDFALLGLSFSSGSNQQAAILGLSGWGFSGALNKTQADFNVGAFGLLTVKDIGAISLSINLKVEMLFTRD